MVGEEINVRVIEVDRERRRLILSERQALQETRETLKDRLLDELKEGDYPHRASHQPGRFWRFCQH